MKIQFNEAQLSRPQQNSLIGILDVLQSENENELEVTAVDFPLKLKVKLDDDIEMLLGWDDEKKSYAGLTTPEPEPDPILESQKDTVDLPKPEPELDLSPVVERVEALARALVKLLKPFDVDRRLELWMKFCVVLFKELME